MLGTLNAALALFKDPYYLEIGVGNGASFHGVTATRKVAVDPYLAFDVEAASTGNPLATYHEASSDAFFSKYLGQLFDVIYIDGHHTSDQTLRDLINSVVFSKPNSIIIIDDIGPNSYASSLRSMEDMYRLKTSLADSDPSWMGDVYRLVYFIDTFMQQYTYASPIGGNPQLVLWRQARAAMPERTLEEVGTVDFFRFMMDQDMLRKMPIDQIVAAAKAAGAGD